jgi:hypothetical protein
MRKQAEACAREIVNEDRGCVGDQPQNGPTFNKAA